MQVSLNTRRRRRRRRLLRNLLLFVPCLFLISLLAFAVLYFSPGDAAALLLRARLERANVTAEQAAAFAKTIGYDKGFGAMYTAWLAGLVRGDFGYSPSQGMPALAAFWSRFRLTLLLALLSGAAEAVFGLVPGLWAGLRPRGLTDRLVSFWSVLTFAIPSFWVALILVWFLAMKLRLGWAIGYSGIQSLVIPALLMGFLAGGQLARLVRKQTREVLMSPFTEFAQAQGLKPRVILASHVLPHVLPLGIAVLVIDLSGFIGGAILVESIFNIPGFSRLLEKAISVKDFSLLSTSLFWTAALISGLNLLADALYPQLDARNENSLTGKGPRRRREEPAASKTKAPCCQLADCGDFPKLSRRRQGYGE